MIKVDGVTLDHFVVVKAIQKSLNVCYHCKDWAESIAAGGASPPMSKATMSRRTDREADQTLLMESLRHFLQGLWCPHCGTSLARIKPISGKSLIKFACGSCRRLIPPLQECCRNSDQRNAIYCAALMFGRQILASQALVVADISPVSNSKWQDMMAVLDVVVIKRRQLVMEQWLHEHPTVTEFALDGAWGATAERQAHECCIVLSAIDHDGHLSPVGMFPLRRLAGAHSDRVTCTVVDGSACGMEAKGTKMAMDWLLSHGREVTKICIDGDVGLKNVILEAYPSCCIVLDKNHHLRNLGKHVERSMSRLLHETVIDCLAALPAECREAHRAAHRSDQAVSDELMYCSDDDAVSNPLDPDYYRRVCPSDPELAESCRQLQCVDDLQERAITKSRTAAASLGDSTRAEVLAGHGGNGTGKFDTRCSICKQRKHTARSCMFAAEADVHTLAQLKLMRHRVTKHACGLPNAWVALIKKLLLSAASESSGSMSRARVSALRQLAHYSGHHKLCGSIANETNTSEYLPRACCAVSMLPWPSPLQDFMRGLVDVYFPLHPVQQHKAPGLGLLTALSTNGCESMNRHLRRYLPKGVRSPVRYDGLLSMGFLDLADDPKGWRELVAAAMNVQLNSATLQFLAAWSHRQSARRKARRSTEHCMKSAGQKRRRKQRQLGVTQDDASPQYGRDAYYSMQKAAAELEQARKAAEKKRAQQRKKRRYKSPDSCIYD